MADVRQRRAGLSLSYPDGWETAACGAEHRCRWFDPEPFDVDDPFEPPLTAIAVRDTIGSFQQAVRQLENPYGERPVARDGLEIGGRQAVRFETELTQDFRYPAGTRRCGYVLDHGGDAFWIETRDVRGEGLPYDENKEIVDEVVCTVEFR